MKQHELYGFRCCVLSQFVIGLGPKCLALLGQLATIAVVDVVQPRAGRQQGFAQPADSNQKSDNIVVFRLDQKTGRLSATGQVAEVPSPVCLKFTAPFS